MPIGLNDTDIQVDYGGGNVFNIDTPKYLLTTTTEVSDEEIPIVNKDILTRTQYNNGSDVTSGLVAHYKFDDETNLGKDELNHRNLVNTNTESLSGVIGYSSYFADGDYLHISDFNFNLDTTITTSGLSISLWFKLDSTSDYYCHLFMWGNHNTTEKFALMRYNLEKQLVFQLGTTMQTAFDISSYDTWINLIITIDINRLLKVYENTLLIHQFTLTQSQYSGLTTSSPFTLGKSYDIASHNFKGYLDDFRVYDRSLTTTEISNLYNLSAVNIEEGDISGTNDKYIAYKYIGGNDNGSGQSEYNLNFNNPALCDILVVGGGGAGGGNGQGGSVINCVGGGGGAGALLYYENIVLHGDYTIKVGNGGIHDIIASSGSSGFDSEIKRTSDGKQQFLAKGGGGGSRSSNDPIITPSAQINVIDSNYKYLYLTYDSNYDNESNQTEYYLNIPSGVFECDILLVGGGCTGHRGIQDGGAGGAVVYETNYVLSAGSYTIYVPGTGKLISARNYLLDSYTGTSWEDDPITQFSGLKNNSTGEFLLRAMGAKPSNNWNIQGNTNPSGGTRSENIGSVLNGAGTNLSGGGDGYSTKGKSGNGQDGPQVNITGVNTYYAGGGGGGNYSWPVGGYTGSGGSGGQGGGGNGARWGNGGHAQSHTGGGGGGAGNDRGIDNRPGGNGGSGVVIIRYAAPSTYLPLDGGSGGGGAGDSTSGKLVDGNILNDIPINIITGSAAVVEHYDITMFPGDKGVDSLNDIGCFGNHGGIEMSGGNNQWGAGGGGAGSKGAHASENAGDGGSGKKYDITGNEIYYSSGGNGTSNLILASTNIDADPHTGSGGSGAISAADFKGGNGGSGIVVVRYKNENISTNLYIPQGNNATEYTILDCDNTNLVAHYKFDEGAEYRDSVYGYYDLIDLDNTSLFSSTEKVFGKSAHESGTEAKIQFPDSIASQISEISSTTGITFSFWFNMNTSSGSQASLFEFSDTTSDTTSTNRIGIARNGTANSIWIGIKEDNVETSTTCGIVDNEWHHITWSIDNKGTWQVYFDGINQYPNKYKQIPRINNYDYSYLFGSVQSSQTNGYIDDFRIYNKVLNSLEITYLANKFIKFTPKEIDSEYNLLTFLYHDELADDDELVYDFGTQSITNYATFAAYAYTIPGITGVETFNNWNTSNGGGVGAYDATQGNPQVHGTIKIPLPNEYDHIIVEYAQVYGSANATINLYVDTYANLMTSAVKSSITNYNARTFEYSYSNNDYLMIEDPIGSEGILGNKLRITFLKKQSYNLKFDNPTECDILIVGGGGGGGGKWSGGGGGGDVRYHSTITLNGTYKLIVGNGGTGASNDGFNGENGFNSLIYKENILLYGAAGGGGGRGRSGYATSLPTIPNVSIDGVVVSEGGGGGGNPNASDETGILGQYGFSGDGGLATTGWQAGGGGGSGGSGISGNNVSGGTPTMGGPGTQSSITGIIQYYGGGGGGGEWTSAVTDPSFGQHGGGRGREGLNPELSATDGVSNTGGGGGGGGKNDAASIGANGGSGVILVRYKRNMGTPTITTTTELAQWKYSATNANVVHKGNVGIGTFPLTNYNLNVKGDINTNNLYKDGCLIGAGKIRELNYSFPYFTSTPNVSSTYITGTSYKYITFVYDPDNDNGSNQTEYSFDVLSDMQCDILIVGGGGGGGAFGGGGGGGGLLFAESTLLRSNKYTIKVGNGGAGAPTYNNGVNGTNGYNSSININGSDYIAVGGGGGGTRNSNNTGKTGSTGGSGGGGSHSDVSAAAGVAGGTSTQLSYEGWESYGNNGGKGRNGKDGNGPTHSSGGGGGAGYQGEDAIQSTQGDRTWSTYGGGGDGGIGMDFSSYFGTNVGHNGWFAGGGGGQTYNNAGRVGWGNSYNGTHDNIRGFGGGGDGGFNGSPAINSQKGMEHTGGGGGGAQTSTAGASGGSGVVIIRYLDTSYTNEPTITNNADSDILFGGYNTIMLTYDSTNDNGNNQTNYTLNVTSDMSCEVLIVAGGGGGGMSMGGGGGGGGVIHLETLNLKAGAKTISVGNGGDYAPAAGVDGQPGDHPYTVKGKQGANSVFDTYIAIGGGYGGSGAHTIRPGGPGGSGGGGSGYNPANNINESGAGTPGQGFRGAYGRQSYYSGGGGGAGEIGGGGEDGAAARQRGGDGLQFDILGTPYYWGGGGGGSGYSTTGGNGGKGGGGGGAVNTTYGGTGGINDGEPGGGGSTNSHANRPGGHAGQHTGGGGGGGSHHQGNNRGGYGGSGVVIIKYSSLYELTTTDNIDYTLSLIDANKTTNDVYNIMSFKHIDNIISDMHPTFSQDAVHLIAHYKFDGNYEDSNPQSTKYHLTNVDTELVVDGNIKSVLIDNDADELYTTDNMPAITSTSTYSWCCWIKRNEERYGANHFVFSQGVSGSTTEVGVLFIDNNRLRFYVYSYDLDITIAFNDTAVISRYNHFVFTINNNTIKIYENGILRGSRSVSANVATNKLYIGKRGTTYSRINVADFRVYDKELSDSEVLELYTLYNLQTEHIVNFPEDTECDILIVGGGGAGGGGSGDGGNETGGGGAGGVLYMLTKQFTGEYKFIVGNGGILSGGDGSDSKIIKNDLVVSHDSIQLIGYGGGGGGSGNTNTQGIYGRPGGSAGGDNLATYLDSSYSATATQGNTIWNGTSYIAGGYVGNKGMTGGSHGNTGGGGGGAGGSPIGVNNGGIGVEIDITGVAKYYAGGGGSAGSGTDGIGGLGGGGDPNASSTDSSLPENGKPHTGGGGGGAYTNTTLKKKGGNGGSGIIIIRYKATLSNPITYRLKEWNYNTLNANTQFTGKVGIGTNNPSGDFEVAGSITKSSINFKIQHPLNENKWLQHGSLEGPRYDNIYRGKKVISGGYGEINIDTDCNTTGGMATGTFAALNGNPFLYLRNNQTYDRVIGEIDNGIVKVNCENTIDDIEIEWMVIGERKDNAVKRLQITDNQGRLLCERQL